MSVSIVRSRDPNCLISSSIELVRGLGSSCSASLTACVKMMPKMKVMTSIRAMAHTMECRECSMEKSIIRSSLSACITFKTRTTLMKRRTRMNWKMELFLDSSSSTATRRHSSASELMTTSESKAFHSVSWRQKSRPSQRMRNAISTKKHTQNTIDPAKKAALYLSSFPNSTCRPMKTAFIRITTPTPQSKLLLRTILWMKLSWVMRSVRSLPEIACLLTLPDWKRSDQPLTPIR
mmetsp:Transcript_27193/g.78095  ORF Transcript_27193/g.78095 Transcript_27193/m.78095 type:complete len:235 (+) Transcript_27193:741-1445(+)